MNKTRYYVELGERRSPALKLTRRLTARIIASARTITIRGHVSPPLGKPVRPVVISRTRVPTRHTGGGTFETFALVLGADPGSPTSL